MTVQTVWSAYFSPTGTGRRCATTIAAHIAKNLPCRMQEFDFTTPSKRDQPPVFSAGDLVLFATPVYAGRVPNLLLPYISSARGEGALAVPLVLYGNRAYDDALVELRNTLEAGGFRTIAGAAFIGEHSFGTQLASGRPDAKDLACAVRFADAILQKLQGYDSNAPHVPVIVPGNDPPKPYYQPKSATGSFIDIRKVKPVTEDSCTDCGICAEHCPMGSISLDDPREIPGICIKCNACVKACPQKAKQFTDPGYLFHRDDICSRFSEPRKEAAYFI